MLVVYSVAASGQASSAASCNTVPFRREHYEKHMRAALHSSCKAEQKATTIPEKWIMICQDAGKPGNHSQMSAAFVIGKQKMAIAIPKKLTTVGCQDNVKARYARVAGFHNMFEEEKNLIFPQKASMFQ